MDVGVERVAADWLDHTAADDWLPAAGRLAGEGRAAAAAAGGELAGRGRGHWTTDAAAEVGVDRLLLLQRAGVEKNDYAIQSSVK